MRLVVFIGMPKVGSTALQHYLAINRIKLAKNGILYPATDFLGLSRMLAEAMEVEWLGPDMRLTAREPHNALAFQMLADTGQFKVPPWYSDLPPTPQMMTAIRQQVRLLRPKTVILVSEVFSRFGIISEDLISDLCTILDVEQRNITIYAAFRRVDDHICSWFGQLLQFGHKLNLSLRTGGLQPFFRSDRYEFSHFDYTKRIEGWYRRVPEANFVVRRYSDILRTGDTVSDFFSTVQVDRPGGLKTQVFANPSIHRGFYEIVRHGNIELPVEKAHHLREALLAVGDNLNLPPSNEIELLGVENRQLIFDQFSTINRSLGALVQREEFFDDLPDILKPRAIPESDILPVALDTLLAQKDWCRDDEVYSFVKGLTNRPEFNKN